jgi:hypothetical protein
MKSEEFDKVVENRCRLIKDILMKKAKEYASEKDRFHNFIVAARKLDTTPEDALMGMKVKHTVSIDDLIDWAKNSPEKLTVELIEEKIGDEINYFILLEGMLRERIEKRNRK